MNGTMNTKKARQLNIIISVIFALTMLLTSYFVADKDVSQNIVLILITLWFIPFLYLSKSHPEK